MMFTTRLLNKTLGEDNTKTEMYAYRTLLEDLHLCRINLTFDRFMTANRTVRTGLTASAVVSVCFLSRQLHIPDSETDTCSPGFGPLRSSAPVSSDTTTAWPARSGSPPDAAL